MHIELVKMI